MSTISRAITCDSLRGVKPPWQSGAKETWWSQHREASLNWLALGVLLAAWNASENEAASEPQRRPDALRGYPSVSVRAATLHSAQLRARPTS